MTNNGLREVLARVTEVQDELGELRTEVTGELGDVRSEIRGALVELRVDTATELSDLRTDLNQVEVRLTGRLTVAEDGLLAGIRTFERSWRRWAGGILAVNGAALAAALLR